MDKTSLFDVIARDDTAEQERIAGTRAISAVKVRVGQQFQAYLMLAKSPEDFAARVGLISDRVNSIVDETCEQYDASDRGKVLEAAVEQIHVAGGHKSDCGCGFCSNKGKLPGSTEDDDEDGDVDEPPDYDPDFHGDKESATKTANVCSSCQHPMDHHPVDGQDGTCSVGDCSCDRKLVQTHGSLLTREAAASALWMTAAEPLEDGDSYTTERTTVDAGKDSSPTIDKGSIPKDGLKPIEIPSVAHPSEMQSMTESVGTRYEYGTGSPDPTGQVQTQIDADKPLQPEHTNADGTSQWTGTGGLANPVTKPSLNSVASKWSAIIAAE